MELKPGVSIAGLRLEMLIAIMVADGIYTSLGYTLVITSAMEGEHSRGSLHYLGCAIDTRIRNFTYKHDATNVVAKLQAALGASFDIVLHKTHIHIEFHPKKGANLA